MKHISDFTNVTNIQTARAEKEEKEEMEILDPLCANLVDRIFVKFSTLFREYDALYADDKRLNAEKLQWTQAFSKRKLRHQEQIQSGIDAVEEYKYGRPPQLGQFLDWCKPSISSGGFPSPQGAYLISLRMNGQFSDYAHPCSRIDTAVRHAVSQIGRQAYRQMKEEQAKLVFERNYEIACRQIIEGSLKVIEKSLPEKADPHPDDAHRAKQAREKAMEEIKGMGLAISRRV